MDDFEEEESDEDGAEEDEEGEADGGDGDVSSTTVLPHTPHGPSTPVFSRSPLQASPVPLPNQRVIKADAERTRGDPKTVERLLTHFCRFSDVKYKQGLNELLAPFLTLDYKPILNEEFERTQENDEVDDAAYQELVAYCCFEEFLKKFLPTNVYR